MKEETTNEKWIPLEGYEGLYEVSDYGKIRSLNYYKQGRVCVLRCTAKNGKYLKVTLHKAGHAKTYRIHRLVAAAFLPKPSKERNQVNHINGNKTDNRASNLEWCTSMENHNNPATIENNKIRYHKQGEWENRSKGQKKRFLRERTTKTGRYSGK